MAVRDPYAKKFFRLEIDGISPGGFESAQGLSWENEVLEFQEGGRNDALVRLPGQGRLGKVTLVRGYAGSGELYAWARSAREGDSMRKAVDIVVLNDAREEVARYTLLRAWPTKYETKELAAQQGHAVESMELAHEGIIKSSRAPAPGPANVAAFFGPVQSAMAAAEMRARDANREARRLADAAEEAARAAGAVAGAAGAIASAAGSVGAGLATPAFVPTPPTPASGASALDAAFAANAAGPGGGSAGVAPGGARDAMVQGSPPGNVVPHPSAESFSAAMADGGAPPAPAPGGGSGGSGFAASGATGAAATSAGDWSDGAPRQQPPGQVREPSIQTGSTLRF